MGHTTLSDASRDCNGVTFDPDQVTFAEAGSSQEAKRWADSTIRSRECRQRKKLKLMQRTIRISPSQVMKLIALGYLGSRGNRKIEACAIEAYLADNL
jgi:hypothetical protein